MRIVFLHIKFAGFSISFCNKEGFLMENETIQEKNKRRRVPVRFSEITAQKLDDMSDRYGMSVSALVNFIVGQWLDNNYDMKDYTREKMIPAMMENVEPQMESMLQNPVIAGMFKEMAEQFAKASK